ncbi:MULTISPECIES: RICIN domain-containing protein [unclassified Burkholderia]|uniref:RICIN domain-containing protein n=1 Tax=unclassified Burkholderia TaxID=2613784 RepID=UPI00084C25A7|nr:MULTISPECIES: RICIN domain-containing protein [unclassified Burkholderia]MBR8237544.1 RICIN domain-containing protein [Burkholderia sp. AU32357]MBY4874859.1 RICIN domain-containing protein [Burkholderia sp. AU42008]OED12208.1 hypothetical protein A9Z05_25365 [Burkholderia sp. A2]OXI46861.1 hypothetical protein CFB49_01885 [Burkholderia sp. AU17457]
MGQYIIEYAQDPDYRLAVTDQISGSAVVLRNKKGLTGRHCIWDINFDNGIIALSGSGDVLAIGADRIAPEAYLKLKPTSEAIPWDFFDKPGYIVPFADPNLCLDDKDRVVRDGNPIWLYPVNGSPAQQWKLVSLFKLKTLE